MDCSLFDTNMASVSWTADWTSQFFPIPWKKNGKFSFNIRLGCTSNFQIGNWDF